jgi:hypothetical protein
MAEQVICIKDDMFILNPIAELYSEGGCSGDAGDYDRIVLDLNGVWHWEHNEFYPEYYQGQRMAELVRDNDVRWFHNIPASFPSEIEIDDPVYGEAVNTLCWYEKYQSINELVEDNELELNGLQNLSYYFSDSERITCPTFRAFINKEFLKYSPKKLIQCIPMISSVVPPKNYCHWMDLGFEQHLPSIRVFYPINPRGDIEVILYKNTEAHKIKWSHGRSGLFTYEIRSFIDKNWLKNKTNEYRVRFLNEFIGLARAIEKG